MILFVLATKNYFQNYNFLLKKEEKVKNGCVL